MEETTKSILVGKGFKDEDITHAFRGMFSYHNKLNDLQGKIRNDESCTLRSKDNLPVIGSGSLNPEILVISDAPSDREAKLGQAGFDDYALYLMVLLGRLGLSYQDVYWTFAVKYKTNRMKMSYIKECYPLLKQEIITLDPTVIIALGNASVSALAGEQISVQEAQDGEGCHFEIAKALDTIPVFPIPHPRSFMNENKEEFQAQTRKVWKCLKGIEALL